MSTGSKQHGLADASFQQMVHNVMSWSNDLFFQFDISNGKMMHIGRQICHAASTMTSTNNWRLQIEVSNGKMMLIG